MNENEFEGAAKDIGGKIKDGVGGLTGNPDLQVDGKIDQATGKLQGKYSDAMDQLGVAAGSVADKASELAGRASSTVKDAAASARRGAGQAGETVYNAGARAGEYMGQSVQQQPLLSLIGAAAIGYGIAFLIHSAASPIAPEPKPRRYFR